VGGICSILIRVIIAIYFTILFQRMITLSDNKNETFPLATDQTQEYVFGDTDIKYLITLFDFGKGGKSIPYDDEVKKYLTVIAGN